MEWLQGIEVVICKARIPEESFGDVGEGIGEVAFAVVNCPVMNSYDSLQFVSK